MVLLSSFLAAAVARKQGRNCLALFQLSFCLNSLITVNLKTKRSVSQFSSLQGMLLVVFTGANVS